MRGPLPIPLRRVRYGRTCVWGASWTDGTWTRLSIGVGWWSFVVYLLGALNMLFGLRACQRIRGVAPKEAHTVPCGGGAVCVLAGVIFGGCFVGVVVVVEVFG